MGTEDDEDIQPESNETFSLGEDLVLRTITASLSSTTDDGLQRLFAHIISIFQNSHSKVLRIMDGDYETSVSISTIRGQNAVYIQEETKRAVTSILKRIAYWATDKASLTQESHRKTLAIHGKSFGITETGKESIKGTMPKDAKLVQEVLTKIKATLDHIQGLDKVKNRSQKPNRRKS